jgi:hypothetical protein
VHLWYSARLSRASCRHRFLRPTTTNSTKLKAVIKSSVTLVQPTPGSFLGSSKRYESYESSKSSEPGSLGVLIHPTRFVIVPGGNFQRLEMHTVSGSPTARCVVAYLEEIDKSMTFHLQSRVLLSQVDFPNLTASVHLATKILFPI